MSTERTPPVARMPRGATDALAADPALSDTRLRAARWFAVSRVVVAVALLLFVQITELRRGADPTLDAATFWRVAALYGVASVAYLAALAMQWVRARLDAWIVAQVLTDLVAFTLLIHAAGGVKSGLGALMIASVAGAAVVSTPLIASFLAAAAALLLLLEGALRVLTSESIGDAAPLLEAGLLGAGAFITAAMINWLAGRLLAQEALARSRGVDLARQLAITRQVIAELEEGVVVLDAGRSVRAANPRAWQLLGMRQSAAADAVPGDQAGWRVLTDAVADPRTGTAGRAGEFELPLGEAAGARRLRVRVLPLSDAAAGDTVLLVEDLRQIEERAQQLKLASMGRLSASIAHEIRNPLAAIRHANGLLAEGTNPTMAARLTGIVEANSVRIDRIVEDVLTLSRREPTPGQQLDVGEVVDALVGELCIAQDIDVERIEIAIASRAPISFDAHQLRQVLVNLVGNALRYASAAAGAVRIEWAQGAGDRLELRIADDGPGLGPEKLQHVFEPFFTTEARGTGLGLYLARELCRANGAALRYEPPAAGGRGAFVIEPRQ